MQGGPSVKPSESVLQCYLQVMRVTCDACAWIKPEKNVCSLEALYVKDLRALNKNTQIER